MGLCQLGKVSSLSELNQSGSLRQTTKLTIDALESMVENSSDTSSGQSLVRPFIELFKRVKLALRPRMRLVDNTETAKDARVF